jgi:hypothetical protein
MIPQFYYDSMTPIFLAVEHFLLEWSDKAKDQECLPLPFLMTKLQAKFSWDNKQFNAKEPVIRDYFRDHPLWYLRQGAYGGIGKRADKDKKEAVKLAKEQTKRQVQEELAKKLIDTTKAEAKDDNITLEIAVVSEVLSDTDAAE